MFALRSLTGHGAAKELSSSNEGHGTTSHQYEHGFSSKGMDKISMSDTLSVKVDCESNEGYGWVVCGCEVWGCVTTLHGIMREDGCLHNGSFKEGIWLLGNTGWLPGDQLHQVCKQWKAFLMSQFTFSAIWLACSDDRFTLWARPSNCKWRESCSCVRHGAENKLAYWWQSALLYLWRSCEDELLVVTF